MVSRRDFLKKSLLGVIGLAALSKMPKLGIAEAAEAPPLPWPYVKLDPEETRKLGHLGYYAFECGAGAFWAIAVQLKEKVGYPWTLLPIPGKDEVLKLVNEGEHMLGFFHYGFGGAVGWGSLCGALNGSLLAINMVVKDKEALTEIGRLLLRWYETTPLPSEKANSYGVNHQFYPKKLKSSKWLPQSVSHSVLCHVSVGNWCRVSGYASGSPERSERCGRLTGDTAAMAVELLNAYFDGRLDEVAAGISLSANTVQCRTCHYKGKDYETGQFTRGFMECESCHIADIRPHAHIFVGFSSEGGSTSLAGRQTVETSKAKNVLSVAGASAALGLVAGTMVGAYAAKSGKEDKRGGGEGRK
jgi:hypothetical protein